MISKASNVVEGGIAAFAIFFAVVPVATADVAVPSTRLQILCANPGIGLLEEAANSSLESANWLMAVEVQRCHNDHMMDMLGRGGMHVAVHGGPLDIFDRKSLRNAFPNHGELEEIPIAWFTVCVVVHPGVGIQSLTADQIGRMCTGKLTNWEQVGGPKREIVLVGQDLTYNSADILRRTAFPNQPLAARLVEQRNKSGVVEAVKKTPGAIGYFLHDWEPIDGLRPIAVARCDEKGKPIGEPAELSKAAVLEGRYPLVDPLIVVFHPDAPQEAYDFVEFLKNEQVAKIAEQRRLLTVYHKQEIEREQRLLAAKKGEGPQLRMVGPQAGSGLMRELTEEYVKSHEVVQVPYVPRTQTLAVRDFSRRAADWKEGEPYRRGADIIIMDDKIQRDTWVQHGPSWQRSIHPQETWELGRIGVAVVAHKSNPVDWLSMEELRDIYTNRLRDWERLERGNVLGDATPLGAMKRYGLKAGQPVFLVFADKTLGGRPMAQTIQRDTTEEVIASVALDPAAIGFVSLTDLKHDENRVKILGITPQDGLFPETIGPEGPTENYPLQQRWTLYLGPYAYRTPETRRFAEFLTSNETAAEIMRKNGLIASSTITADPLKGITTKSDMEKPVFVVPE